MQRNEEKHVIKEEKVKVLDLTSILDSLKGFHRTGQFEQMSKFLKLHMKSFIDQHVEIMNISDEREFFALKRGTLVEIDPMLVFIEYEYRRDAFNADLFSIQANLETIKKTLNSMKIAKPELDAKSEGSTSADLSASLFSAMAITAESEKARAEEGYSIEDLECMLQHGELAELRMFQSCLQGKGWSADNLQVFYSLISERLAALTTPAVSMSTADYLKMMFFGGSQPLLGMDPIKSTLEHIKGRLHEVLFGEVESGFRPSRT